VNTVAAPVKGDINGDRVVNNLDVIQALKIAGGLDVAWNRMDRGDVNADAKIDMVDVVKIARKISGLGTL
jgi:hypothetical protein